MKTTDERYAHAFARGLALDATLKTLHLARNEAYAGEGWEERDRLQKLMDTIMLERQRTDVLITELSNKMLEARTCKHTSGFDISRGEPQRTCKACGAVDPT